MRYKYCPECKAMNREGDASCYQCGKSFAEMEAAHPQAAPIGSPAQKAAKAAASLDIGEVLRQSIQLYIKSFPRLAALTAVIGAATLVAVLLTLLLVIKVHVLMAFCCFPVFCLITPVFWASHMRLLLSIQREEKLSLSQCLTIGLLRGFGLFLTLLVVAVVAWLALVALMFALGPIMLFVLPLVALLCTVYWFLFVPCSVLEDHIFFSGFSRSSELVRPHLPKVALLALVAWLIGTAASSLPGVVSQGAAAGLAQLAMQSRMPTPVSLPSDITSKSGATIKFEPPAAPSAVTVVVTLIGVMIPISLCVFISVLGGAFSLVVPFVVYWHLTGGHSLSPGV